jgi:hypothetical protein
MHNAPTTARLSQAEAYGDTVAHDVSKRLFAIYGNLPIREENRICREYRKRAIAKFLKATEND